MELENNFHDLFFTKKGWIGISRMLATTFVICLLMCAVECTCIYAIEVTRFDVSPNPFKPGHNIGMSGWVWGRDFGIAFAIAWPLSWILSNLIPGLWVNYFFKPMEAKHGAPKTPQKIMGFVMVTFSICLFESLIMSLVMYTIDLKHVLPKYMNRFYPDISFAWDGKGWGRIWGVAIGISFPWALIVTSIMPMLMKKLFMKIDGIKAGKAELPFNETDLAGKVEYLEGQQKDIDTLTIKKPNKTKKAKSKK